MIYRCREHTVIVIMSSTAASVAVAMEVIAALGELLLSTPEPHTLTGGNFARFIL